MLIFDALSGEVRNRSAWPKGPNAAIRRSNVSILPRVAIGWPPPSFARARPISGTSTGDGNWRSWTTARCTGFPSAPTALNAGNSRLGQERSLLGSRYRAGVAEFDVDGGQAGQPNVDVRMYTVCYSPAGDLLATAQLDGTVKIWKLPELSLHGSLKLKGRFIYGAISFSPDGLWLATGSLSGEVTLWDVYACEKVFDVGRHEHYVYTLGFGRDVRTLVMGGDDGLGYLWDLRRSDNRDEREKPALWDDLASDRPGHGVSNDGRAVGEPELAVSLVAEHLRP